MSSSLSYDELHTHGRNHVDGHYYSATSRGAHRDGRTTWSVALRLDDVEVHVAPASSRTQARHIATRWIELAEAPAAVTPEVAHG